MASPSSATTSLEALFKGGRLLNLTNECALNCSYCGYPAANDERVDLGRLEAEAIALQRSGKSAIKITGKDPGAHPQFGEIVSLLLRVFAQITVQTTGVKLHEARGRERWAADRRITWEIPFVSLDPALHDAIVGRPGHHRLMSDLLLDPSLVVEANVLLIRRVLDRAGFGALMAWFASRRRVAVLRFFTPRDTSSLAYYLDNVPSFQLLWEVIEGALDEVQLKRFVEDNLECFPPCTVPTARHGSFLAEYVTRVLPGDVRFDTPGVDDVLPCPNESRCGFGAVCLGVHRVYTDRYGVGEFEPDRVAASAFDGLPEDALLGAAAAREEVRPRNVARDHVAQKRWRSALRVIQPEVYTPNSDYGQSDLLRLRREALRGLSDEMKKRFDAGDDGALDEDVSLLRAQGYRDEAKSLQETVAVWRAWAALARSDQAELDRLVAQQDETTLARAVWVGLLRRRAVNLGFERFQAALRSKHRAGAEEALRAVLAVDPENAHARRELSALGARFGGTKGAKH